MTASMKQSMAEAMAGEDFDRDSPDYYRRMARAALEAMRSDGISIGDYIWNKRITAALTEGAADGEGE